MLGEGREEQKSQRQIIMMCLEYRCHCESVTKCTSLAMCTYRKPLHQHAELIFQLTILLGLKKIKAQVNSEWLKSEWQVFRACAPHGHYCRVALLRKKISLHFREDAHTI